MKKIIFLIGVAAATINSSNAQEDIRERRDDFRRRLLLGAKIGANYSNVYDVRGGTFNTSPKLGLATGAFLAIPIGRYIGVQPELLYSQKGFQSSGFIRENTYNITRTTSYIDVPILFALKPSRYLTFLAGPQYSYLVKQSNKFANASTSIEQEREFENDNIRKNTLCFTGGFDINVRHFVLGARAGWDVRNNIGDGRTTTLQYKNLWYQGTIGYRFYRF